MELFTIYADADGIRARFILHLSDFITDHSPAQGHVDEVLLEHCVTTPEDVSYFFPRGEDIFRINVRGSASNPPNSSQPPTCCAPFEQFNLTHMNRGRNAYQASHCYSVADHILEG